QRVLYAKIDRKIDWPLQLIGGKTCHVQSGEALPIQPFFNAGDALVVDVHMADFMCDHRPVGIDTLVLGQEAKAGNTETMDLLQLAGCNFALEPDKATFR